MIYKPKQNLRRRKNYIITRGGPDTHIMIKSGTPLGSLIFHYSFYKNEALTLPGNARCPQRRSSQSSLFTSLEKFNEERLKIKKLYSLWLIRFQCK